MKEELSSRFRYWQWRVIICTMIGYSMFYFVRKNFSFAMPALKETYGITNTSFGIILSLVGILYGISKFINGFVADRTNARWHLVIGLTVCALLNYAFGFSATLSTLLTGQTEGAAFIDAMVFIMAVLLIANNIFQGCGFAPCNRLMVHWVPPKELATKMSFWNTSHSVGAGLVSVLCGYIVGSQMGTSTGTLSWQWCFWIPAIIATLGVFFILVSLRDTPTSVGLPELPGTKTELDENDTPEAYKAFIRKKVFLNPIIWMLAITDLFVYIVRFAVLDWGPTFLQNREVPLSPELAGWTIAIFEIAGCAGMICAGWISDHLFRGKAQRVCAIEMILVAICLVALHILPSDANSITILILLAVAGFFLYGPQALLGVIASNQVTKKAASSAVGLIGLMSYVSVIFTGAGLGWFSDQYGWDYLFILMSGVSILGFITISLLWNIKDDGYIHEK